VGARRARGEKEGSREQGWGVRIGEGKGAGGKAGDGRGMMGGGGWGWRPGRR